MSPQRAGSCSPALAGVGIAGLLRPVESHAGGSRAHLHVYVKPEKSIDVTGSRGPRQLDAPLSSGVITHPNVTRVGNNAVAWVGRCVKGGNFVRTLSLEGIVKELTKRARDANLATEGPRIGKNCGFVTALGFLGTEGEGLTSRKGARLKGQVGPIYEAYAGLHRKPTSPTHTSQHQP